MKAIAVDFDLVIIVIDIYIYIYNLGIKEVLWDWRITNFKGKDKY